MPASAGASAHTPPSTQRSLQGHYAGVASRFVAYVVDLGTSTGLFMLALTAISFAVSVLVGHAVNWSRSNLLVIVCYLGWLFVYFAYSWAVSGRTFGMALLGVRVVCRDGGDAGPRRAVVRTLALPLSFLLLGLGFLGILLGRERRALHDVIADTAVVYSWDARAAQLRFLAHERRTHPRPGPRGLRQHTATAAADGDRPPRRDPGRTGLGGA